MVDVASFGGTTKQYQSSRRSRKADFATGWASARWKASLRDNNVNAGGSFIEQGLPCMQVNVRAVGLVGNVGDIRSRRSLRQKLALRSG